MSASPPPLVAVPGLGLGPESWRPTLDALAAGSSVRLLRGYGLPCLPRTAAPTPAELEAELAADLVGPTVLLGHSSSCQVVAHAARLAPDTVVAVVLVGPTTDPRARTWPRLLARWLRTAVHEDPRQAPSLVRQYRRTTLRSMLATMDRARRDDLLGTLAAVPCPVLLVRGRHDRIAPRDWLGRLARTGAGREVTELAVGAHMVPLTHARPLADAIAAFVRQ